MDRPKLTKKQEAFCAHFVKTDSATESYVLAYKPGPTVKKQSIAGMGYRLSKKPVIQERIQQLQDIAKNIANERLKINSEEMLRHLNILRQAKISDYLTVVKEQIQIGKDKKGNPVFKDELIVNWKPFDELTEDQLTAIESVKQTKAGLEIKLYSKEWTIDKINRHIGFYKEDNEQLKAELKSNTVIKWGDKEIKI